MEKDSKFTRDENGYIAIRTVPAPYSSGTDDKDSMFTRDEDGYVAVRVVGSGGGGGGDQHNLGYYATPTALREAHPTAEAGDWAIVGSTDTVWIWDTDNSVWVDSDQKGQVTSVNNKTGDVTVQETLISGTNIKTINNTSILGSGNLDIDALPSQTGNAGKFLKTDGINASWESTSTSLETPPTLVAANWSSNTQTITVQGVTATNTVIVSPIPTDAEDYAAAGILCTGQATNALTFTCQTTPASDLQVNIVIM